MTDTGKEDVCRLLRSLSARVSTLEARAPSGVNRYSRDRRFGYVRDMQTAGRNASLNADESKFEFFLDQVDLHRPNDMIHNHPPNYRTIIQNLRASDAYLNHMSELLSYIKEIQLWNCIEEVWHSTLPDPISGCDVEKMWDLMGSLRHVTIHGEVDVPITM